MSDDSDDEANIRYGTPLEEYDEDELPKKKSSYQDVREQYAVDSHGKRRFHGAFTGGFTAGYGNTVGAPEGFTPATFKSSRSDRQQKNEFQKPEDFMDDEDRSEFGIAPRQIQPNTEFSGFKRKRQTQFHDGPIPGAPVLESLLQPAHETVAVKILRSMGWRSGKGVGEKVTAEEREKAKKVYTCFIPHDMRPKGSSEPEDKSDDSSHDSEDDEEYSNILFEPNDFELYIAKPKSDVFGLGYSGLSRHSVLGSLSSYDTGDGNWKGSHLVTTDKGKKVSIRGQAFGVGALEEDDEDIYGREDMSNYDFTLGAPSPSVGKKGKGKDATKSHIRHVLEGFVPASKANHHVKVFPPPALPRDYVPCPPKSTRFSATKLGTNEVPHIRDRGLGRHDLSAKHRGQILGEEVNASSSSSVMDASASVADKSSTEDKIAVGDDAMKDAAIEKSSKFKPFAANAEKQLRYESFIALKDKGLSLLDCAKMKGTGKMAEWERVRELKEFEQAYKLYRPLTGLMNDRFISAARTDDENSAANKSDVTDMTKYASDDKIEAARLGMFGRLTREKTRWVPESLLCKRFNVPEPFNGGYVNPSKDKKKLTYSIFEYLETPAHDKHSFLDEQTNAGKQKPAESPKNNDVLPINKETESKEIETQQNVTKPKRLTTVELFLQEKEKEKEELLKKKPQLNFQKEISEKKNTETQEIKETIDNFNKIDLYKAVFLSDSESENETRTESKSDNTVKEISNTVEVKVRKSRFDSPPKNVERNDSPPKGIFANLNFDRLNSWQNSCTRNDEDSLTSRSQPSGVRNNPMGIAELGVKNNPMEIAGSSVRDNSKSVEDISSDAYYGPKLPERHKFVPSSQRAETKTNDVAIPIEVDSSSSDDSSGGWVDVKEAESVKEKSNKRKKEKKAKKKSKHKHKHKDRSKHKKKKHKS